MSCIVFIAILLTWLCLASSGCSHRPEAAITNQQLFEEMRAETERAFELERRAGLVIFYERSSDIRLWTPAQTTHISATDETLAEAIASVTPKRKRAAVIIGKPARHEFPEPQLCAKVDMIEAVVRAQGFTRVIFQVASATGWPIYRE